MCLSYKPQQSVEPNGIFCTNFTPTCIKTDFGTCSWLLLCSNFCCCFPLYRECLAAVQSGLCIVLTLLSPGEHCDAAKLLAEWGMVEVIGKIRRHLPNFPDKDELCSYVILKMSSPGNQSMDSLSEAEGEEERGTKLPREAQGETNGNDGSKTRGIESEVISAVRSLRYYSCHHGRNPFPRLLKLISKDLFVGDDTFVCPSPEFTKTFLGHSGVLCLAEVIAENKSSYFVEGALLWVTHWCTCNSC